MLVDIVPNEFLAITMRVEDCIHRWCYIEVSERSKYGKENEQK